MSWQILLSISVVTYSVSVILQRVLLRDNKSDPIAFAIVFQLITGSIIGVYAFAKGFSVPNFSLYFYNFILTIFLYSASNIFIFKSLKLTEASTFTIFFATRAFWSIIAAFFFLKESFSTQYFFGTVLIFVSIILVSFKSYNLRFNRGELYALIAALFFGIAFVNDAVILRTTDAPSYLFFDFTLPALVMWLIYPKSTFKMKALFNRDSSIKLTLLGILYAISAITVFLAYQIGHNASQIAPLSQTSTILTVLFAIILLKEKDMFFRKILAAILSFIGVILLK